MRSSIQCQHLLNLQYRPTETLIKAAVINIFISTSDQMAGCNLVLLPVNVGGPNVFVDVSSISGAQSQKLIKNVAHRNRGVYTQLKTHGSAAFMYIPMEYRKGNDT